MEYVEGRGKNKDDAIADALNKLGVSMEEAEFEVIEEKEKKLFGLLSEGEVIVQAHKKKDESHIISQKASMAVKNLEEILVRMEINGDVHTKETEINEITLNIHCDEDGALLIGRAGETLDSFEHILSLIVNKEAENRLFINVDTENYREKRRVKLEKMAQDSALEVKQTGRPYEIRKLNSKERKIIHQTIANEEGIETISHGDGFDRTIVIKKKQEP